MIETLCHCPLSISQGSPTQSSSWQAHCLPQSFWVLIKLHLLGQWLKVSSQLTIKLLLQTSKAPDCQALDLRPTVKDFLAVTCKMWMTSSLFYFPKGQSVKYFNRWGFRVKHRLNYSSNKIPLWILQRAISPAKPHILTELHNSELI